MMCPLQGAKMDYAVAVDAAGQAARQLMGPAGVSGIPHAFIIGGCLMEAVQCLVPGAEAGGGWCFWVPWAPHVAAACVQQPRPRRLSRQD